MVEFAIHVLQWQSFCTKISNHEWLFFWSWFFRLELLVPIPKFYGRSTLLCESIVQCSNHFELSKITHVLEVVVVCRFLKECSQRVPNFLWCPTSRICSNTSSFMVVLREHNVFLTLIFHFLYVPFDSSSPGLISLQLTTSQRSWPSF